MPRGKYKTRQRDEIMRFFEENEDKCLSAREISRKVEASEATVFRTLAALADEGLLKRFTGSSARGDCAYYQLNTCTDEHIHLKCEKCGRLIHMDCDFMKSIIEHFKKEHGFTLDCTKTVIYGLCGDCAEGNK